VLLLLLLLLLRQVPDPLPDADLGFVPALSKGTLAGKKNPPGFPTLKTMSVSAAVDGAFASQQLGCCLNMPVALLSFSIAAFGLWQSYKPFTLAYHLTSITLICCCLCVVSLSSHFPMLLMLLPQNLSVELKMAGVNIFGHPAKKESLVLQLPDVRDTIASDAAAPLLRGMLCGRVYVKWPYLQEAEVRHWCDIYSTRHLLCLLRALQLAAACMHSCNAIVFVLPESACEQHQLQLPNRTIVARHFLYQSLSAHCTAKFLIDMPAVFLPSCTAACCMVLLSTDRSSV
jgi:hypothetical protein